MVNFSPVRTARRNFKLKIQGWRKQGKTSYCGLYFFHNRVHLRVHRLGEVKTCQWHYKAHVYPDVFIPQTVSFHHCAFIFPLPTIKWSSSVCGLKIWFFLESTESIKSCQHREKYAVFTGLLEWQKSSLLSFQVCSHSDLKRQRPDRTVFQINFFCAETTSPSCVFLGDWSGSRSGVMVYTVMCNHWNISFHGLSAHSGNLHGPRLRACLSARLGATAFPSNPDPASDKPIHGSMGWFIQHNFAAAQRFVI